MSPVFLILLVPLLLVPSAYAQLPENSGFLTRLDISIGPDTHEVRVVTNSDVNDFKFDAGDNRLTLFVTSQLEGSLAEMVIPQDLLGGELAFHLNGQEFFPAVRSNGQVLFVVMNFTGAGENEITVTGTSPVRAMPDAGEVESAGGESEDVGVESAGGESEDVGVESAGGESEDVGVESAGGESEDVGVESAGGESEDVGVESAGGESEDVGVESAGGGCLIATAAFGSEMSAQVQQLREVRDRVVQTESGRAFMDAFNGAYYLFSPAVADYERHNPVFKEAVKILITPMLYVLSILNHAVMDSEGEVLAYGSGVLLLGAGLYVAPVAVLMCLRGIQWRRLKTL